MNPNSKFESIVSGLNGLGIVLNGEGEVMLPFCHEVADRLVSSEITLECIIARKSKKRILTGSLSSSLLGPHTIIYARKIKVILGDTGLTTYFGRNAGFSFYETPHGEHPLIFKFERNREIKTPKAVHRANQARLKKDARNRERRTIKSLANAGRV